MTDIDKQIMATMEQRVTAMTGIEKALWLAGEEVRQRGDAHSDRTELARRLGVTNQAIHNYMQDGYLPRDRAAEVSSMYGVPLAELVKPA